MITTKDANYLVTGADRGCTEVNFSSSPLDDDSDSESESRAKNLDIS